MAHTDEIEMAILNELNRRGSCPLEELARRLPGCGWNQLFAAVDRLSRKGILALRRPTPLDYLVAVGSPSASMPGPSANGGQ